MGEVSLSLRVGNHIVGNVFLRLVCFGELCLACCGEDVRIKYTVGHIVVYMLYNHRGLLLAYDVHDLADKFFGIVLIECHLCRTQTTENCGNTAACEVSTLGNLTDKVILHSRGAYVGQLV